VAPVTPAPAPPTPAPDVAPVVPDTPAPVAAVAPVTPVPAVAAAAALTPAPAAIAPGTPPPDRGLEAAMLQSLQPPKRPWVLYAAGAAILLVGAWFLRPQPRTDTKDAPWLERFAPAAQPVVAVERAAPPGEKGGEPPKKAEPQTAVDSQRPVPPAEASATPASDQLYAKALEQGDEQLRRGKYRAAISHFQRAVKEKPQSVPALLALGDAFLEADKPRSALRPLESAARLDGQNGRAQLLLGTAYQSLGKNPQALKAYRRYLELEPEGEFARDVRLILANLSQ
jgi:tetratricopeptide (TPR) repeat protein